MRRERAHGWWRGLGGKRAPRSANDGVEKLLMSWVGGEPAFEARTLLRRTLLAAVAEHELPVDIEHGHHKVEEESERGLRSLSILR